METSVLTETVNSRAGDTARKVNVFIYWSCSDAHRLSVLLLRLSGFLLIGVKVSLSFISNWMTERKGECVDFFSSVDL